MPVRAPYDFPPAATLQPLESTEDWTVLSSDSTGFLIVPLALDTLDLPALAAVVDPGPGGAPETLMVAPPVLVVDRTMPDTSYVAEVFIAPLAMDIPPGFPSDYLDRLEFWALWSEAPPGFPWLPVGAGAAVLAALAAWFARRNRRSEAPVRTGPVLSGNGFAEAVLALLESPYLASGDYMALYRELDLLLRRLLGMRSGRDLHALTHRQIRKALAGDSGILPILEGSEDLVREIGLQRYAGWGSTREKAQSDIRKLASLGGGK
ncbi:MAG TPA: hypothetical protein P5266_02875 [Candidatus Fermentibacter sp.]|nr:hypothetical protein [Candidatus Fermentibacter sp.]